MLLLLLLSTPLVVDLNVTRVAIAMALAGTLPITALPINALRTIGVVVELKDDP